MKSKVCKHCGYCEECGRGGHKGWNPYAYPWISPYTYPYINTPYYQTWCGTNQITVGAPNQSSQSINYAVN